MIEITDEMVEIVTAVIRRASDPDMRCTETKCASADFCMCRNDAREALTAIAPLIAAAEREACARVADDYARETFSKTAPAVIHSPAEWMAHGAEDVAEAIRARSNA
jgi:hypothetical protein